MTGETRTVLSHLASCVVAPYRVLGEAAPTFREDAAVVRAYEAARAFGELSLALRERLGGAAEPLAPLVAVLEESVSADPSGRLALGCLAVVAGPRLLVSLRDARRVVDEDARELVDFASDLVVAEIVAIRDLGPALDDAVPAPGARVLGSLGDALEAAGYAESFGLGD